MFLPNGELVVIRKNICAPGQQPDPIVPVIPVDPVVPVIPVDPVVPVIPVIPVDPVIQDKRARDPG